MQKVIEFLQANPVQFLATVGRDGKGKCRPFMFSGDMRTHMESLLISQVTHHMNSNVL